MAMPTHKVFVYGSLKKEYGNHSVISGGKFLREALTKDSTFTMFSFGGFPGIYRKKDGKQIAGELYEVDDEVMQRLDYLEGNGSFYNREIVPLEDGTDAWMYITMGEGADGSKERVNTINNVEIWA